jgi:hypothetical protein
VSSNGNNSCIAFQMVVPPIPESNKPIGFEFFITTKIKKTAHFREQFKNMSIF